MNAIILKNIQVHINLGITELERKNKQLILIDLTLKVSNEVLYATAMADNINKTIDYSDIHELILNRLEDREFNTVEAVCGEIADMIHYRLRRPKDESDHHLNFAPYCNEATIHVKKPWALSDKNVECAAVELDYRREEFEKFEHLRWS